MDITCPACKQLQPQTAVLCAACQFPFQGTEQEKARHIGRVINKKGVITDSGDALQKSQWINYGIAGITILQLLVVSFLGTFDLVSALITLVVAGIFFVCGRYIFKHRIVCTAIPLVLYLGLNVLNYLFDPDSAFRGIIIKLAMIGALAYSIYMVLKARQVEKELGGI